MARVIGWDVGGANVKAAHVSVEGGRRSVLTAGRPFEIWRDKESLPDLLAVIARELPPAEETAVTMTAELSDVFRAKREGVEFVLDAVSRVSPAPLAVFTTAGDFVDAAAARERPLDVAASNWMATALLLARYAPDAILVDVGSTTTDVVPIQAGRVVARGRTDPERLLASELVYTGALRTNVAAVVHAVPLWGGACPVAAEFFAIVGDVHALLGNLDPSLYSCPTPDGRPPTSDFAAERLARVVCADAEMLDREEIVKIARAVAEAQVRQIAAAVFRVGRRFSPPAEAIATGLGAFLARRAAAACGLAVRDLSDVLGADVGFAAPAVAVAWLRAEER
jgi:hypothetical protein